MKSSSLFRQRGQKLISKRLNSERNEDVSVDNDQEVILIPIAKKRKQFKGLNFDQECSTNVECAPKPQTKESIGLICEGAKNKQYMYRDKNMEEYIQTRLIEEKQKTKINTNLEIDPTTIASLDQKMMETQSGTTNKQSTNGLQQEILKQLPENILNADPLSNNRDIIDKPIQWVTGMMEVPNDPMSKIKTMERMIQEKELEIQGSETMMNRFLNGERKVISRGPRGNFQGLVSNRIQKGEYSQMMKTLNFDHTQAQIEKGSKINSISEKTRREREKQLQNQINQNM